MKSKSTHPTIKKRLFRLGLISLCTALLVLLGFAGYVYNYLKLPTFGAWPVTSAVHADPNRMREHVLFLTQEVYPRNAATPENLNRAAEYIEQQFLLSTPCVQLQPYVIEAVEYRNVIARFGPEAGPLIVVGAHYDSCKMTPGADDNASGVATLLEISRLLGQGKVQHPIELVAYSTEEPPFYGKSSMGSAIHAKDLNTRGVEVAGMICLEMVGYYSDTQPYPDDMLKWLYPKHGHFIGVIGRWEDRGLVRFVKKGIKATPLMVQSCTMPMEDSDHRNYWCQGYSAVMITDTAMVRNNNYHDLTDTANTLNYENMACVADGVACALLSKHSL